MTAEPLVRARELTKEYVRGDAHTNTIEGYFSIFKHGMIGVYQHCAEKHLLAYPAHDPSVAPAGA